MPVTEMETLKMWWIQPKEIADRDGNPTGRWRMTASSDEGGGRNRGDTSHDHATAEEAEACDRCDEYVSSVSGMYSRKQLAEMKERAEREADPFTRVSPKKKGF
jgi:hypothetical protein